MCGIAGFWSSQAQGEKVIQQMTKAIRHRGPDDLRWTSCGENLWLGHARLRIIDLTDSGSQPMSRPGHSGCLVFNGEIYNFQDLRKELETTGEKFHGMSDSEVLLAAYQKWGEKCVDRFIGMFALAVWDEQRGTMFLARDRAGKKPLFYLRKPGLLVFASEPKAILCHPEVETAIRAQAMPSLAAFGYPETGESAFQGIRQIPAGSWALFQAKDESWKEKTYWIPRWRVGAKKPKFFVAAKEVRKLLENAVRRRLVSDVPLGAFLSGGLDSTIIVGLMTRMLGRGNVRTFSIGFKNEPAFDESEYADQAAKFHGSVHTLFQVEPPPFSLLEKLVELYDAPFADSSAIPTFLVAGLARKHVTVVLTGDGGDEIFAGYSRMAAAVLTERLPFWLRKSGSRSLIKLVGLIKPGQHARSRREYFRRLATVLGEPLPERYLRWISVWSQPGEILKKPLHDISGLSAIGPEIQKCWDQTKDDELLGRILEINYREYLGNDLLVKVDRCTMGHGLEARCPFLDHELFDFCASLPTSYHLQGMVGKRLLRAACSDLLPPQIQERKKMGFGIPLGSWLRGPWRQGMDIHLNTVGAPIFRFFQFQEVQKLIHEHLNEFHDHGHKLWLLLTCAIWLRHKYENKK